MKKRLFNLFMIMVCIFFMNASFSFAEDAYFNQIIDMSKFYEGHTPDKLFEDGNYLAAINDGSSSDFFEVSFKTVTEINNITFKWYDSVNYPSDFKVYLRSNGNWINIANENAYVLQNTFQPYYQIKLNTAIKADAVKFVANKNIGQQRLLMERIYINEDLIMIEDLAEEILKNKDIENLTEHQKIVFFMKWISENITDNLGTADPVQTVKNKKGACGDKSHLLIALCKVKGIDARLVNLYNYPKPGLGHTITEIYWGGKWRIYDPTYASYYLNKKEDLNNYKNPDVASLLEIKKNSDIVDNNAVVFRLDKYNRDFNQPAMYAKGDAYEKANPSGTIGFDIPMNFPAKFDLSAGSYRYGKEDGFNSDMQDINSIPAGIYTLGSSYHNVNHIYQLENMEKGKEYILEVKFIDINEFNFNINVNGINIKNQILKDNKLELDFIAINNCGEIMLKHNYNEYPKNVLIDYISIRKKN